MLLLVAACRDFSTQFWGGVEAEGEPADVFTPKESSLPPVQGRVGRTGPKVSLADSAASIGGGLQPLLQSNGVIYEPR